MTLPRFLVGLAVRMMRTRVLDAASVGGLAAPVLRRPGDAVVIARFERSFCLDVDGKLITIGDGSLHDGPLNLRLASRHGDSFTTVLGVEPGQRWMVSPDRLKRMDGLAIDLSGAVVWQPNIPGAALDPFKLKEGLDHLLGLLKVRDLEDDGLSKLVLHGANPRTAVERAARPHIEALKTELPRWLSKEPGANPAPAIQLLGLGPGLTPSGDDLLAGLLIAWHHLGAATATNRLGPHLLAAGKSRTTPLSLAHLDAAARGYGASPLHHLLNAVTVDRRADIAEALDAAAKIGHSSGLDAIAGMVLALTAWLQADSKVTINA